VSAPTNAAARDRETWITAKFRDGSTRRYWGDPEEAAYWDEFETRPEPDEPANDDEIPQPSPVGKGIIPQPGRGLVASPPPKGEPVQAADAQRDGRFTPAGMAD